MNLWPPADKPPSRLRPSPGQSLAEYLVTGGVVGLLGIAALTGFNLSFLQSLTGVKTLLSSASPSPSSQTNSAIMSAYNDALAAEAAQSKSAAGGGLYSVSELLSQIDPANLPEVSGGNGNVALASSSLSLIRAANTLEALAKANPNLDVSDLVYNARVVAAIQLIKEARTRGTDKNVRADMRNQVAGLALQLAALRPGDPIVAMIEKSSFDSLATSKKNQTYDPIILNVHGNYKTSFANSSTVIKQLVLQTQQAQVVQTNGGAINTQNAVVTSGETTVKDANAINQCQNATCTPVATP